MVLALSSPFSSKNSLAVVGHAFTCTSYRLTGIANVTELQNPAQSGRVNLLLNVEQRAIPVDTRNGRHRALVVLEPFRRRNALEHKRRCRYARATDDEDSSLSIRVGNAQHREPCAPHC